MSDRPDAGLLLPAIRAINWIIFVGLWTLVTIWDLKEKKILHRHLRFGLWVAAVSYSLMLLSSLLGHWGWLSIYYGWDFYRDLAVYIATSALVSVALWHVRAWPAGDAKLYAFLAVIFPMLSISGSFHSGWLFLDVLINIFIPASISVFVQATHYIWITRVRHFRSFAAQLGFRRGIDYALHRARESAAAAAAASRAWLAAAAAEPRKTAVEVLQAAARWIFSMFVMALISCSLMGLIPTPLLRTVVIFAAFMAWQQFHKRLDRRVSALLILALVAALFLRGDPAVIGRELLKSFSYVTLFSICLSIGMRMSLGIMKGQVIMYALPILMGVVSMYAGKVLGALAHAAALAMGAFGLLAAKLSFGAGAAGTAQALARSAGPLAEAAAPLARAALPLSAMGLFFGISFVFVRIWDDEDHPDVPVEKVLSFMVLHRSFHKLLSEDEDFYSEHFESSYADGLTPGQAEALKAWCLEKRIETVPMTTTMSFAHWIFLGYFATWALGGSVLKVLR